jgi:hypothetical protein
MFSIFSKLYDYINTSSINLPVFVGSIMNLEN